MWNWRRFTSKALLEARDSGRCALARGAGHAVANEAAALLWKLQPGRHVIRAVDDLGRADSRQIAVTEVK